MATTVTLLEAALFYAKLGWRIFPAHSPQPDGRCSCGAPDCKATGKHPRLKGWQEAATTDPDVIRRWWQAWPEANIGVACGKGSDLWVLDVDLHGDGFEELQRLWDEHDDWPHTVRQTTGSGGWHYFFRHTEGLANAVKFRSGLDVRTEGGLVILPPSLHASGQRYEWTKGHKPKANPVAEAPEWLLALARVHRQAATAVRPVGAPIPEGERDQRLASDAGAMRRRGMEEPEIKVALMEINRRRCVPPLEEDQVSKIAHSVCRYEPSKNGHHLPENKTTKTTKPPFVVLSSQKNGKEEAGAPCDLPPEALYGLPGQVVHTLEPHTESGASAILASFLVGAGYLIGHGPHVYRDGARHGTNEFACVVGLSAVGRKGTATRRVEEIFHHVMDSTTVSHYDTLTTHDMCVVHGTWRENLLVGLGSGEALVAALAEDSRHGGCPRRLVFEEEFSKPLKVMQREGSTLSETLRAAWDGSILANVTKGRSLRVAASHVSILAHITESEMRARLGATEMFNGFANRFLWFCTQRSRSLPFGGGDAPIAPLVYATRRALDHARALKRVEFDDEAKAVWGQGGVYDALLDRPSGLLGAVTSRAEAHVTRLALVYSLLDCASEIRMPHLMAALSVWDLSERSCAFLFGASSGDDYADTIDELLQDVYPGALTRTEIRDKFSRNAAPGRIPKALALLEREGKARCVTTDSGGRPVQYWCSTMSKTLRQNDKSPLELARSLTT